MSNRGRRRERERVGEREGKVFIEKWGFAVPFLVKESFQDQVSVSQFSDQRSAIGLRLRLDCLTQDGESDSQMVSLPSPLASLSSAPHHCFSD